MSSVELAILQDVTGVYPLFKTNSVCDMRKCSADLHTQQTRNIGLMLCQFAESGVTLNQNCDIDTARTGTLY